MRFSDICMDYRLLTGVLHGWMLEPSQDERCAVLRGWQNPDGTYHVVDVETVPNRHAQPQDRYSIRVKDVADVDLVIGVMHTHTRSKDIGPSMEDVANLPWSWFGLVWNTEQQILTLFDRTGWQDEVTPTKQSRRDRKSTRLNSSHT